MLLAVVLSVKVQLELLELLDPEHEGSAIDESTATNTTVTGISDCL